MKFRSKSVEIEAEQWFPGKEIKGVIIKGDITPYVITIHNQITYIESGDWIIKEPDGIHYYPCKPDIFEKRWEQI